MGVNSLSSQFSPKTQKYIFAIAICVSFIALTLAVYLFSIQENTSELQSIDWRINFRPAALEMLHGRTPYAIPGVYNPPWAILIFTPLALLPLNVGAALMFTINLFTYGFVAYKLGAKPLALIAFVLSPLVLDNGYFGNFDWLIALGFILPPQLGLFLVLAKPQIGIGVVIYWLAQAWRAGKLKAVIRTFAPVIIAFLLSFLIYGFWPALSFNHAEDPANWSMWPMAVPIGVGLLVYAIRRRRFGSAISSSPFLTPFLSRQSWAIAILGMDINTPEFFAIIAVLWILRLTGLLL